jgi:hypothetical protein
MLQELKCLIGIRIVQHSAKEPESAFIWQGKH